MFDHLKHLSKQANFFLGNRWNSPLQSATASEMQSCLWPSSDDFYHPLNPMFAPFFTDPKHVGAYDVVLLRDGAHTLLDFYLRFPAPKKSRTLFLVSADLYFLVPEPWRPQTYAYRMGYTPTRPTKKLVFYGLISETFVGWNRFKYHVTDWLKQFPCDADVSAYFVLRNEPINHTWEDRSLAFEITGVIQNHFEKKIEFLSHDNLKKQGANADATFVSLDFCRTGVSFCAVENSFLGQAINVQPRGTYTGFAGEKIGDWPLSFGHSMSIYTGEAPDTDFNTFFFMKKMGAYPLVPKLLDVINERLGYP